MSAWTNTEFKDLPEPVRLAAEKFFNTTSNLKAMKGVEYGETSYELEGVRKGDVVEGHFRPRRQTN